MQHVLFVKLFLLIALFSTASMADSLKFGIFPYLSAAKLLNVHNPLALHLSSNIDQPVNLLSAPGFGQFIRRTKQHKYDIIMTAPHMGALAIMQSNYQRLAVSSNKSHAVFISLKTSKYKSLKNIRNASFTMPPVKAIISKLALQTLSEQGVIVEQLDINYTQSHNNALKSVLLGVTDIAAIGLPTWNRISDKEKEKLQLITTSKDIPGFMVLASNNLPTRQAEKISRLLLNYHLTEEGVNYFNRSKIKHFRAITDQDLSELKPFVKAIFNFH